MPVPGFLVASAVSLLFSWKRRSDAGLLPVRPSFALWRRPEADGTFSRRPPQPSCVDGPDADMPWITSVTRPQVRQAYS